MTVAPSEHRASCENAIPHASITLMCAGRRPVERTARVSVDLQPSTASLVRDGLRNGSPANPPDDGGERDADPPPVTTIAWRLRHIAVDFFDDDTH